MKLHILFLSRFFFRKSFEAQKTSKWQDVNKKRKAPILPKKQKKEEQ